MSTASAALDPEPWEWDGDGRRTPYYPTSGWQAVRWNPRPEFWQGAKPRRTETHYEWDVIVRFKTGELGSTGTGISEKSACERFEIHQGMGTEPTLVKRRVTVTKGDWEEVAS